MNGGLSPETEDRMCGWCVCVGGGGVLLTVFSQTQILSNIPVLSFGFCIHLFSLCIHLISIIVLWT